MLKKWILIFSLVLALSLVWAQGSEDFTNSAATTAYADGSFVGNGGITWNYGHSRDEDLYPIDGKGLMIRRASDSYLTAIIPGGIENFSFQYRKAFTGASARQLELYVNNVLAGTTAEFGTVADVNVYTYTLNNINAVGDVTIKIKNVGATSTNRQTVLDNIVWTGYTGGGNFPPVITNIIQIPASGILSTTTVSVSATVTDDSAVQSVKLKWGTATGTYPNTINMSAVGSTYTSASNIPAQVNGTTVYYVIYATDDDSDSSTSSERSYTVRNPATTTIPYTQEFTADLGDTYNYDVAGSKSWYWYGGKASCNGFGGENPEEHWLVLPGINFNNYTNERMTFNTIATYGANDANNYLKLYYSTNYLGVGSPSGATWTEIPFTYPASPYSTTPTASTPSGVLDLSAISGTNVYLAFKYYSNLTNATRWEIDDINIYSGAVPTITVSTASLSGFTYVLGDGPSAEQSFSVSGSDLARSIQLTAPTNFQISTVSGTGFTPTSPITLPHTDGSVANTPIYVRMTSGLGIATYTGNINITSTGGATPKEVALNGEVTSPPPPNAPVATDATAISTSGFTANWNTSTGATGYYLDVYTMGAAAAANLIISEYIEGSSYRKALEIFNGTGSSVDLSNYSLMKQTNGAGAFGNELALTGTLAHDDAYVIAYTSTSSGSYITGDMVDLSTNSSVVNFNGNDAVALYHNGIQIDVVGIVDQVTPDWGKDITLVRKAAIISPSTAYSIDDWDQYPVDTLDHLGSHSMGSKVFVTGYQNLNVGNVTQKAVTGLSPNTTYKYVVRAYNTYGASDDSNEKSAITTGGSSPTISVAPSALTGFTYEVSEGPSAEQNFIVSGSNLTGNITITAPTSYEMSTGTGVLFVATSPITLTQIGGSVANKTIYVRLKASLAVGDYNNEQIVIASAGVTPNKIVSCSGSVTEPQGESQFVHYWNFNVDVPATDVNWDQPINATQGTGQLTYTFANAVSFAGTPINGMDGEVNGGSFSPQGGEENINNGEHFEMTASTTGYEDIIISYAVRPTATGFKTQEVQYSINGTDFITKETVDVSGNAGSWRVITIDFSQISAANNNPNFKVRVILDGATAASGNNRFDNIQVNGTAISGGDLDTPVVTIVRNGNNVDLSWTAITGASSYRIESSDDPYGTFTQVGSPTANTTISIPATPAMKFFKVIAIQ
ncbi:MAG: lamin tail domain-containing protein [Candidatus Cloacimonetes bacterium]|nr:lamin tail domain-containing protein [Candidatus Cloacimonadota bacterium]